MKLFTAIRFIPVLIGLLSSVLFTECKRTLKDEEILGPEYRPAPEGFGILTPLTPSNASPSFPSDVMNFSASFSSEVSWTLTITGNTSGAKKIITGLSNSLNASNSVWDGGATSDYFFKTGESVTAVLSFLGTSVFSSTTLSVLDAKPYSGPDPDGVIYKVIENFETSNGIPKYNLGSPFKDQGDGDGVINGYDTTMKIQGDRSFHFYGTDINSNSWIAGLTTDSLNIDSAFRASAVSPDDFFINLYVYGTGKPNSSIQIKTYEIDDWSAAAYSQKYDQTINDGWVYDIYVDWTGWKLVSVRYSQFKRASDPALGGNGNGVKQPQNITGFGLGLNSIPTFGMEVEAYVDFLTVTEGGAFKP